MVCLVMAVDGQWLMHSEKLHINDTRYLNSFEAGGISGGGYEPPNQ